MRGYHAYKDIWAAVYGEELLRIEAYSPIMACCVGVYFVYVPLDFDVGVKALFLTASLAAFIVAEFTEDKRCPVGESRRSSDGLKKRCSAIVKQQDWCTKRTCENFS